MAVTHAQEAEILKVVVGLFNAAPGKDYLNEMANLIEDGMSISQLADFLAAHTFFVNGMMGGKIITDAQVAVLMENFGVVADSNDPESAGSQAQAYFTQQIDAGVGFGQIVYDAVAYLSGNPAVEFTKAVTLLANKALVAASYSASVPSTDLNTLQDILSTVTGTTAYTENDVAAVLEGSATTSPPASGSPSSPSSAGKIFTLTTGVDSGAAFTGAGRNDVFNADLSAGSNTLGALDELNGGDGTDTLNVILASSVTPASLASIEIVKVTSTANNAVLDLTNASSVTSVKNVSSSDDLSVTDIAANAALAISNVASFTTSFAYAVTSGTETATLEVTNVTGGADAEINIAGVETITITSVGAGNSYELKADAATTLNFAGATAQTVVLDATTLNVSNFDASAATAAVTLTTIDQTSVAPGTSVTVLGGSGNDTLTLVESNDLIVNAGAGNDTIVMTGIDLDDTVDGDDGTDILSTTSAQANVLDAATPITYAITNIETLSISNEFDGSLTAANIATSINKVVLGNTGAVNLVAGGDTIIGAAGSFTIDLGASGANNAGAIAGALTVTDTGTATTDALTVNNKAVNTTTGLNINAFGSQALTSTGYENLTIDTGAVALGAEQTITTLTITPDVVTADVSLTLTGSNAFDVTTLLTTTSTGLLTVDASGLTAQAAGTTTLDINNTASGVGGTQNITGSAGDDSIITGNFASIISGGEGDDIITGGTTADNLSGDEGDDVITGSGGNDIILGGDGDDIIDVTGAAGAVNIDAGAGDDTVAMATFTGATDTLVGGDDRDTLSITAAITTGTVGERISGFEVLSTTATAQVMTNFVNNAFTEITQAAAGNGTLAITNAGSALNTLNSLEADALVTSFSRLVNGAADSLTVVAGDAIIATSALTASGEETIVIDSSNFAVDLDLITSTSLKTLTLNGDNTTVIDAQAATALATINASGFSGSTIALTVDASDSTTAVTFTGGTNTGTTTLVTGSGNDMVTAGAATAVFNVTTGLGNDTVIGNAGADIINTGSGADIITGGNGADSITGGSGDDTITLTETTAAVDVVTLTGTGMDTITGFTYGASGDQIEFDISDLEAAYNVDFANLDDGASTAATDGLIQEVTGDVAATANATFFVLRGTTFADTNDVENNLETGDYEISHAGIAAGDAFLVAYSDGTDGYVALVRDNTATSATDFTAGELSVTNIAKLVGNTSIDASEFNIANFDFIA